MFLSSAIFFFSSSTFSKIYFRNTIRHIIYIRKVTGAKRDLQGDIGMKLAYLPIQTQ